MKEGIGVSLETGAGQPVPFCRSDLSAALLSLLPSLGLSFQSASELSPENSSASLQASARSELPHFVHPNIGNTDEQRLPDSGLSDAGADRDQVDYISEQYFSASCC